MLRTLTIVLLLLVVSVVWAKNSDQPVRKDIPNAPEVRCSGVKYILPTMAPLTMRMPMNSWQVSEQCKPAKMPVADQKIFADQIAVINQRLKQDGAYPTGVKLRIPIYKVSNSCSASRLDMRNWHFAVYAGEKWGVSPALLVAIRNHENPDAGRDFYALGVKMARGQGLWKQYERGAYIVKRLIADRQGWNPIAPYAYALLRCGMSYAEGSTTWGPNVWALYCRVTGRA